MNEKIKELASNKIFLSIMFSIIFAIFGMYNVLGIDIRSLFGLLDSSFYLRVAPWAILITLSISLFLIMFMPKSYVGIRFLVRLHFIVAGLGLVALFVKDYVDIPLLNMFPHFLESFKLMSVKDILIALSLLLITMYWVYEVYYLLTSAYENLGFMKTFFFGLIFIIVMAIIFVSAIQFNLNYGSKFIITAVQILMIFPMYKAFVFARTHRNRTGNISASTSDGLDVDVED